jgi:hypothetical protein
MRKPQRVLPKEKSPNAETLSGAVITSGVLISYGVDFIDQHRRAAVYVDRILKGEKPAGANQVRARDQSQDGEGAWSYCAAVTARASQRGDRIGD